MTDVLTHVLTGFIIGSLLSVRYEWINRPYVTVVMVGAVLPDLAKVSIAVPESLVEAILGIPLDWFALHTPFGALITASIGSLLVGDSHRRQVLGLLLVGSASHFVLDGVLMGPSQMYKVLLWPVRVKLISLPMYILSSDQWPAVLTVIISLILWYSRRDRDS